MLAHHCHSVRVVNKRVSMLQILREREVCISSQEVTFNQQVFDLRHIPLIMKTTGHNIVHKCQHLCNRNRMFILFLAKVLDNTLNTAKTILVQRNRCLLAGVALGLSNFIYLSITKDIVTSDSTLALVIVSIASGVGCCLAVALSNRFSKDRTYVNVILSDDKEAMKEFRDFLAENHITNVATDSYTLDWSRKSISITAYAQTKAQSRLIDEYIERSLLKCKRVIRKN